MCLGEVVKDFGEWGVGVGSVCLGEVVMDFGEWWEVVTKDFGDSWFPGHGNCSWAWFKVSTSFRCFHRKVSVFQLIETNYS